MTEEKKAERKDGQGEAPGGTADASPAGGAEEKKKRKPVFAWFWKDPVRSAVGIAILLHALFFLIFGALIILRPAGRGRLFDVSLSAPMIPGDPGAGRKGGAEDRPKDLQPLEQRAAATPDLEQVPSPTVEDVSVEPLRVSRPTASVARSRSGVAAKSLAPTRASVLSGPGRGPGIYGNRGDRAGTAKRFGGTGASEGAVDRGLAFLARHQNSDGSWDCPGKGKTAGVTGLCLLAFLGAGHTNNRRDPYQNTMERAIRFILESAWQDGLFINRKIEPFDAGKLYSHCIATLALAEASNVGGFQQARRPAMEGVKTLLTAQQVPKPAAQAGGWRYYITSADSDLSVTSWAIMALISGKHAGMSVPEAAMLDAARYVKRSATSSGFGYMPGGSGSAAMAASGALAMQFCGYGADPTVKRAIGAVKGQRPAEGTAPNYYFLYYATQAMFQEGGLDWQHWNNACRDYLVELQERDGGWPEGNLVVTDSGRYYGTAMAVLCLEVYYRYLPIFQMAGVKGALDAAVGAAP